MCNTFLQLSVLSAAYELLSENFATRSSPRNLNLQPSTDTKSERLPKVPRNMWNPEAGPKEKFCLVSAVLADM